MVLSRYSPCLQTLQFLGSIGSIIGSQSPPAFLMLMVREYSQCGRRITSAAAGQIEVVRHERNVEILLPFSPSLESGLTPPKTICYSRADPEPVRQSPFHLHEYQGLSRKETD